MKKNCPKCGKEIPEEAAFCLFCFADLEKAEVVADSNDESNKKSTALFFKNNKKKVVAGVSSAAAFLLVMGICVGALHSVNSVPKKTAEEPAEETYIVTETQKVAVTTPAGEAVTDISGEQVFDVITVTSVQEVTTEKQGFFEKIFSSDKTSDNSESKKETENGVSDEIVTSSKTHETTEKQGFWDKIFGKEDKPKPQESTASSSHASSTASPSQVPATANGVGTSTDVKTTAPAVTQKPTESKPVETTAKPIATTTEATTTSVKFENQTPSNDGDFEYSEVNGVLKLTKYTGNSANVVVPATINGKTVSYLSENVFSNNSKIQTVIFNSITSGKRSFYLPHNTKVFNNLPNLTSVTFPFETNNFFLNGDGSVNKIEYSFDTLFTACPKVKAVNFGERMSSAYNLGELRMHSHDGVVCTYADGYPRCSIVWYPHAKTTANYTLPAETTIIYRNAIKDNAYIQSICINANCNRIDITGSTGNFTNCPKLKSFSTAAGQKKYIAEDGVIYYPNVIINDEQRYGIIYPQGKTDSYYEMSSKYPIYISSVAFCGNPYIKTLKLPPVCKVDDFKGQTPPSLTKVIAPRNVNSYYRLDDYYDVEWY